MTGAVKRRLHSFEEFVSRMAPWTARIVHRRAWRHDPILASEDLMQEALAALWSVWTKRQQLPADQLCRLGTTAIVRRLVSTFQRSHAKTPVVSLDAAVAGNDTPLLDLLADPSGLTDIQLALYFYELKRLLSPDELEALIDHRFQPDAYKLWRTAHERRQMETLFRRPRQRELWRVFQSSDVAVVPRYSKGDVNDLTLSQEDTTMQTQSASGLAPANPIDDTDLPSTPAPKTKGKVTRTPKAKAAKKGKTAKAPKAKASKTAKAPKAKASKTGKKSAARKDYTPKGHHLSKGTEIKYLGGSRAEWLKKGATGKITTVFGNKGTGVRYGLRFGKGKDAKTTILSQEYVAKA